MTKKQPAEVRMKSKCSASTGLRGSSPASALWQSPKGARWRLESRLSGGCRINLTKIGAGISFGSSTCVPAMPTSSGANWAEGNRS
jgi:hypothetical protein